LAAPITNGPPAFHSDVAVTVEPSSLPSTYSDSCLLFAS
jgi:hypothetical protein